MWWAFAHIADQKTKSMTKAGLRNVERSSLAQSGGAIALRRSRPVGGQPRSLFASETEALHAAKAFVHQVWEAQGELWDPEFPENGSFSQVEKRSTPGGAKSHWYFDCYQPAGREQGTGRGVRQYLGVVGDPGIEARVQAFNQIKLKRRHFAAIVGGLTESGLPSPPRFLGRLINALARSGLFVGGGVLLGTPAYQTYDALLGEQLAQAPGTHGELGTKNLRSVSIAVASLDPERVLHELLRVDPTFQTSETAAGWQFANRAGYRVKAIRVHGDTFAERLALFQMEDAVRGVVLSGPGIAVLVPSPLRFALAKHMGRLNGSAGNQATERKNRLQAGQLLSLLDAAALQEAMCDASASARRLHLPWIDATTL
jgi:hypothetical protein